MKILYIGGVKSGKSKHAENSALDLSQTPFYLATTEAMDDEMAKRVAIHKQKRDKKFQTIEEPLKLFDSISKLGEAVLVECLTLWINNMLFYKKTHDEIYNEIKKTMELENDIVFVLNDVTSGIIPDNALAREFVDISGNVSQIVASACDEVWFCIAGLKTRIK
ncbi:MAG: adenosylcobinamide kinase / adenosylcobinamide-phosphate guanylyltransferase [Campylobacterota bacterium]|nr:adenosylcobinamide kinase / adenosylcobinamide-phosphate guanylyltransferase [Campylobacterota bacterium]